MNPSSSHRTVENLSCWFIIVPTAVFKVMVIENLIARVMKKRKIRP